MYGLSKKEPEMAEMHTHTEERWCGFSVKPLCLFGLFRLVKIFPGLYNFQDTHISRLHIACEHVSCLACHPCNLCATSAE